MPLKDYPDYVFMPRELNGEEIKDPTILIDRFFDYMHLPQHRTANKEIRTTLVTGSFCHLSTQEKADMLHSLEWWEKVVEAIHIIHKQKKRG